MNREALLGVEGHIRAERDLGRILPQRYRGVGVGWTAWDSEAYTLLDWYPDKRRGMAVVGDKQAAGVT